MNKVIELAALPAGDSFGTAQYPIGSLDDFDNWCLQCHGSTVHKLGNRAPSLAAGTVIDCAAFANGRHRAQAVEAQVGCIYCHSPHGKSNAMLVRENAANRGSAGVTNPGPRSFGVFPNDNLNLYAVWFNASPTENVLFRARNYWENALMPYLPDAADDNVFCGTACHNPMYPKDHMLLRDNTTGNYLLSGTQKQHVIRGVVYTRLTLPASYHVHLNTEIVSTDNMVKDYADLVGKSGPSYYQYPVATGSALPSAYNPAASDLPFMADYADSNRDFTSGYTGPSVGRIRYRFTCSTCHDPHGTNLPNTMGLDGYPDLRLRKANPSTLCQRCHE
jgi:hypothetical protein